ncbi:MAG: hypothetical protein R6X22_04575 [Gemmatimonadota bacterium]
MYLLSRTAVSETTKSLCDRPWLTTQDVDPESPGASILADPVAWQELQGFPPPVSADAQPPNKGLTAAFHPHGKLLYQARDDDIDVYIIW